MEMQKEQLVISQRILRRKTIRICGIQVQIKKKGNYESGEWKSTEQTKYLGFLRKYYYILRSHNLRSKYRIFNEMAAIIVTRNSSQCRSHHQKMLRKYNYSLENIAFKGQSQNQLVMIGEGQTYISHRSIVKQGMKRLQMGTQPFLTLKVDDKLLIVLNQQLVAQY